MGWQKDEIEELAEELGIDGGDSWSQQDRLRRISEEVGMENFNGLSNADTNLLEQKLKERKAQNIDNNGKNHRVAEFGAANKARNGRHLSGKSNPSSKMSHNGRRPRFGLNTSGESGATDDDNDMSNAKKSQTSKKRSRSGVRNSQIRGDIKIKIPITVKLTILIILIPFLLIALAIFVLLGADLEVGAAGSGSFAYGETCTTITVENSGCDELGNNCTLVYDGDVKLEDYVAGVVAAEVGNANNLEFYKLAAIVTRTYVFGNINENCRVEGNKRFKDYIDVNDSKNASMIKQAVAETEKQIILKQDELIHAHYSQACVINENNGNYQIRYGSRNYDTPQMQEIPQDWEQNNSAFAGILSNLYSKTDINNTDYEKKDCPANNNDYGLSQIGAYYLMTEQNYSYQSVLEYYYGRGVEVVINEMRLSGNEDFINPTSKIHCSSPFGTRVHPVSGEIKHHSGLDIAIAGGQPIYAASNGTVTRVVSNITAINNCNYGYGNYIIIEHEDGVSTLYAHMQYGTIPESIVAGERVKKGEQIGAIGSTGCSTGNHLHYEVRENNTPVDPTKYMDLTEATGTCKR